MQTVSQRTEPQSRSESPPLRYRVPYILKSFKKMSAATSGHIILQYSPKLAYLPVYDDVISEKPL